MNKTYEVIDLDKLEKYEYSNFSKAFQKAKRLLKNCCDYQNANYGERYAWEAQAKFDDDMVDFFENKIVNVEYCVRLKEIIKEY